MSRLLNILWILAGTQVTSGGISGLPQHEDRWALREVDAIRNFLNFLHPDSSVLSGATYFYVTTSVDSTGLESDDSNEVKASIPTP